MLIYKIIQSFYHYLYKSKCTYNLYVLLYLTKVSFQFSDFKTEKMENLDLKLDPLNPPKYCPQCERNGIKSKVKKFKVNPNSTDLVIMCKNDKVRLKT